MSELIIGSTGFIGSALHRVLPDAIGTSRKRGADKYLDLLDITALPECEVCYLCAGANGAKRCEGSQDAFRVNVDAPISLAREVGRSIGFLVYISSMSVEWQDGAYQRQKLAVECVLRAIPGVGIVRAGRVLKSNVDDLCDTLIRVGRERIDGVTRWGNDDIAYQK